MKNLIVQKDVFSEDEHFAPLPIIEKYFNVNLIDDWEVLEGRFDPHEIFRGSLALARRLGRTFEYANALKFMPRFRADLVNPEVMFDDLKHLLEDDGYFPLFVRPVSAFKEFSGNVFTFEKLQEEFNWLTKNKNIDPYLICSACEPVKIGKEWRTIFVNDQYVSGSQYMQGGELSIEAGVPEKVVEMAVRLSKEDYFLNIFDFVIDIGEVEDRLALVEINGFETASFYGADLDKVYSAWAKSLECFS